MKEDACYNWLSQEVFFMKRATSIVKLNQKLKFIYHILHFEPLISDYSNEKRGDCLMTFKLVDGNPPL